MVDGNREPRLPIARRVVDLQVTSNVRDRFPVALTNSTACSRNSGEYLLGRPIRTPSSGASPKFRVSTEAGQLH